MKEFFTLVSYLKLTILFADMPIGEDQVSKLEHDSASKYRHALQ